MNEIAPEKLFNKIPNFDSQSRKLSRGIHQKVLEGGKGTRILADLLHGTWLGHPLHPVLTDVTLGAWMFGSFLDLLGAVTGTRRMDKAADTLIEVGTASGVATALAGIADYSTVPFRAVKTGTAHGLMNLMGQLIFTGSVVARRTGARGTGKFLAGLGTGLLFVSAWLGGELVYKYEASTNKTPIPKGPQDWTMVMNENDLVEGTPRKVEVEGMPVMLYKYNGTIYATSRVCGHDGGPLDEGTFDGYCVECPWHQSVYDVRSGSIVHGPTTYALPTYDTRVMNGLIEVRLSETIKV